ncbi:uncharacterized protein VTP21DRAFT_9754 [Calcarisporiella thermophila]|uniref:uncharacterized protein n=1 Tax=Calcarisporiella thermophila TaxID=911321 RepID=UPI003741FE66
MRIHAYSLFLVLPAWISAQGIESLDKKSIVCVLSGSHDESCPVSSEPGLCKSLGQSCQFPISSLTVVPNDAEVRLYSDDNCYDIIKSFNGDVNEVGGLTAKSIKLFGKMQNEEAPEPSTAPAS